MTINLNRQQRATDHWLLNQSSPQLGPGYYESSLQQKHSYENIVTQK